MTLPYSTVILLTDPGARITGGVGPDPDMISSTAIGGQGHPFEIMMHPEFL
jgi:hypothetical protein